MHDLRVVQHDLIGSRARVLRPRTLNRQTAAVTGAVLAVVVALAVVALRIVSTQQPHTRQIAVLPFTNRPGDWTTHNALGAFYFARASVIRMPSPSSSGWWR